MSGFVLHPNALSDLNEIWEFIAAATPMRKKAMLTSTLPPALGQRSPVFGRDKRITRPLANKKRRLSA